MRNKILKEKQLISLWFEDSKSVCFVVLSTKIYVDSDARFNESNEAKNQNQQSIKKFNENKLKLTSLLAIEFYIWKLNFDVFVELVVPHDVYQPPVG